MTAICVNQVFRFVKHSLVIIGYVYALYCNYVSKIVMLLVVGWYLTGFIIYFTLRFIFCSSLAYGLLGQCLIEKTHPGMKYETYIEKYILQPLEMANTGFEYSDE